MHLMNNKTTLLLPLALVAGAVSAHEGHGASTAVHWHATDVFGFIALALVVAALAWWMGRK
jgi:Ca2+/H+ antiporter